MDHWEELVTACGGRITPARRAVVRVLRETEAPLTPQEILVRARTLRARLGLVTVYRALETLLGLHLVRRVHRDGGCHAYMIATQGHHHALVCGSCGRSVEFPGQEDLGRLIRLVEERTGYSVSGHLLQLSGLCPQCRGSVSGAPESTEVGIREPA